ncbi:carbohydrate-binding protein [Flavobacterium saccharophilum]|uniref:Agarase n=1 Tax=Flavobacterium saccharophilum TaxID=29534 RepID=A0A1M7JIH3_9FLAO|nr:carbohydrate-binding protein [Flavobacterium saccharophilum]SHM52701.1 agarase [Flavobacterium saccharophilum]
METLLNQQKVLIKHHFITLKLKTIAFIFSLFLNFNANAQEWASVPVPANAGSGKSWQLQADVSDDFNYTFNATNQKTNFGSNKWYNFYHNAWDGPGTTYWQYNHVAVDGDNLSIKASRNTSTTKMGVQGINSGCITSNKKVLYPVYVEASVSVANISLASDVWLLSPDDTQEIDIIECYGGVDNGNAYYAKDIHLSHHSFVRNPFQDYQPRGRNTWWTRSDITTSWGDYCWNGGNRKYIQIGVNWIGPKHFEYYIDGQLVRVLYEKACATKKGNTWYYTYPSMNSGVLVFDADGYQKENQFATGSSYSFTTLQQASNTSTVNVIDPYNFQGGSGFTKELDIIINVESQDWHVAAGRTPGNAELNDPSKNTMKVDWLRVYKPVTSGGNSAVNGITMTPSALSLAVNTTGNLTAAISPSTATVKTMTFTSNNVGIATVNQSGVVTAKAVGTAIITAQSTDGGFKTTSTVTVSNTATSSIVIEAENFTSTAGTYNDGFVPYGMGKSSVGVNYVNKNDSAQYTINVTKAGAYTITYRISTPSNNATISFYVDNVLISSDNVVNNGQWDNYQTLIATNKPNLTIGSHTVKIIASGTNDWQWNLDKITLSSSSTQKKTNSLKAETTDSISETVIYPVPADNVLFFDSIEVIKAIKIYDLTGTFIQDVKEVTNPISIGNLNNGIYVLELISDKSIKTKRFIVKH